MKKVRIKRGVLNVEVDGIIFTGQSLTPTDIKKINDKNTRIVKGKEVFDSNGAAFDLFKKRLKCWGDGLVDVDDKPLEYTDENVELLWEFDQDFCADVQNAFNKAFRDREDLTEKK